MKRQHKKKETEILKPKNTMTELKSSTKPFNSIFEQIEWRISGQKDMLIKIVQFKKQEEKIMKRAKKAYRRPLIIPYISYYVGGLHNQKK